MTFQDWSVIADIVSAIGLIVSLIYLAIQVRNGNRQETVQGVREAIKQFVNAWAGATSDTVNAENFRNGLNQFDSLSRNEKAVFHSKMQLLTSGFYQVLVMHKNGILEEALFSAVENVYLSILLSEGGQQWWLPYKHLPPRPLTDYLERRLDEQREVITPAPIDVDWFNVD